MFVDIFLDAGVVCIVTVQRCERIISDQMIIMNFNVLLTVHHSIAV
jgi:hypothetical protein